MTADDRIAELGANLRDRGLFDEARHIAARHYVDLDDVLGQAKSDTVSRARRAIFRWLYAQGFSTPEIGQLMGRHHSTVAYQIGLMKRSKFGPPPKRVSA